MLVTPHFSPVDRNSPVDQLFPLPPLAKWYPTPPTKFQSVGFCDWVSVYQIHYEGLPRICDGAFLRIDEHGQVVNTTLRKVQVEGSHETSVFIRCDGQTVWFEGNASRFRRPDNVFGYSLRQCIERINALLAEYELPGFSDGDRFITNWKGQPRSAWTGARITRVDLTENFATGGQADAQHFMRWLAGQQASRMKTSTYGDGETVDFGRGSRRVYSKVYVKAAEIRRHAAGDEYLLRLADWCDSVGLVRMESTYKSTKLHAMGCNYLGGFDMKQLEIDFEDRKSVFTRASVDVEQVVDLPKHLLATYRMWEAGDDLTTKLKRSQFYVHRAALLPYGVDIAIKSNVVPFRSKTRVIQLGPVSPPDWYELPEIERKRYVG